MEFGFETTKSEALQVQTSTAPLLMVSNAKTSCTNQVPLECLVGCGLTNPTMAGYEQQVQESRGCSVHEADASDDLQYMPES